MVRVKRRLQAWAGVNNRWRSAVSVTPKHEVNAPRFHKISILFFCMDSSYTFCPPPHALPTVIMARHRPYRTSLSSVIYHCRLSLSSVTVICTNPHPPPRSPLLTPTPNVSPNRSSSTPPLLSETAFPHGKPDRLIPYAELRFYPATRAPPPPSGIRDCFVSPTRAESSRRRMAWQ